MSLAPGARLGPYEVMEPLGKGGMGEVYRARDSRLGRDVAVKVLPSHTAGSPDALARFEFEARAVASLNHPNILAIYDVGIDSDVSYAVTELLEGETLRDRLARDGPMPPRQAFEMAVQMARGLAAAHGRGIVHRDLKPENLVLTADGRVKILDFGLAARDPAARSSDAETRFQTEAGLLVGTVEYMAPEQIRGEPTSARSDIFSFGLVLYETVTGSNPFRRETMTETMAAILRDQPEPLASLATMPAVPARLVDRCLEKRAEDRPESILDTAFALEAARTGTFERTDEARVTPAWIARRVLAGAVLLVVLLTLLMWAYVGFSVRRAAAAAVADDLSRADTLVRRAQQDRLERLHLHARVVSLFPELKPLLEQTDASTIRDYLQSYLQRSPGTLLLAVLRPGGDLLTWSDGNLVVPPDSGPEWLASLVAAGGQGVIAINGRAYHAAIANAEAGGIIFASLIAAAPVDDAFAQVIREVTEAEAVLLAANGIAGTSLRSGQVPWSSLSDLRADGGAPGQVLHVQIGATDYIAWEVPLVSVPEISAVVLASRDDRAGRYRGLQGGVLAIGLAAAMFLLIAGTLGLSRFGHSAQ
jgi:hypothetical protein